MDVRQGGQQHISVIALGYLPSVQPDTPPEDSPDGSLTYWIFSTGADQTTGLPRAAAYPPVWYCETYNPPGAFICVPVNTEGNQEYFAPPTTTIGPQEADETQG